MGLRILRSKHWMLSEDDEHKQYFLRDNAGYMCSFEIKFDQKHPTSQHFTINKKHPF
ncbi:MULTISPECIES: hypothetical protein [Bacillus]|uniref:Uncharacterized protein n=1 Tax=Bacillus mycoides TaxID=1405 RepID=A0A1E8AYN9_BACMY|nr:MULTISPECIES: hypothetical protein [Bacillus cereus group]OFD70377.1 hypothetical protein BWGOE8_56390 [Bacillus mycoides]OFD70452.1 hypothetical protein BWGOE10_58480 [Bacillus mycoides]OFD70508.1 hypothetical protein BWGOE9_56360 [Bacillus mycoides]